MLKNRPERSWSTLNSRRGPNFKIFQVRYDQVQNPRSDFEMQAVVLETPDWVNVVPLTPEGKILVVDQYRFGSRSMTTEVPAGTVSPGESPLEAAMRELYEETGFESSHWEYLGWVQPNPAFHDNRCHQYLSRDVRRTGSPLNNQSEDITVRELSPSEILTEIEQGNIRHSLALLALSHLFNIWGKFPEINTSP